MNRKIDNKKVISTILVASSVLSSSYLFFMANNLNNDVNKVCAAQDDNVLSVLVDSLVKKLAGKGISIHYTNKAKMIDLLNKLDNAGLKVFTSVDVQNHTVTILGQQFTRNGISTLFNKYKVMYFGDKLNDSSALNTLISDMHGYLINANGSINYDNLEKLNELAKVVTKENNNYKIEPKAFTEYVEGVDCLSTFVNITNLKDYYLEESSGNVKLVYKGDTAKNDTDNQIKIFYNSITAKKDIDNADLQTFLGMIYNSKNQIDQIIKNYKESTDNSYDSGSGFVSDSSGGSGGSGGSYNSGSVSTSSTVNTSGYIQNEKTSITGEGLKHGTQVSLSEKVSVNNIDSLKILDKTKATTKKVLAKVENILKVKNGSTNSTVVDVNKVGSDSKLNDITINLDKSHIGKELYITCIFDNNNIYLLTEGNKWVKLTDDTKEIKGVKMDNTSSLKINDISSPCTFVVTTKN